MFLTFTNLLQKIQHFYVCPVVPKFCLKDHLAGLTFSLLDNLILPVFTLISASRCGEACF